MNYELKKIEADMRLLELLSQTFTDVDQASTEIINLEAILNLPKGTEHFVADLHGEHEAFLHILKNASGRIKNKVARLFSDKLDETELRELCTLIYYPEEKLELLQASEKEDLSDWYATNLVHLIAVLRTISSKYTRSKVRKALPSAFAYIIEELLHESADDRDKTAYVERIIETIILTGQAPNFITAVCRVIQRLAIDQLHILGDIWDRGPGAHIILDTLMDYHNFDIQWGNHDALWMGAAAGNDCCIANVLRLSLRYDNMTTLEDGYGINLLPLATLAMEVYKDDPCLQFMPIEREENNNPRQTRLLAQMHKAISVIQFKLEHQMAEKHPEWNLSRMGTLEHIRPKKGVLEIEGKEYPLTDTIFPTVDWNYPYRLTPEEDELMKKLHHSFRVSDKLQKHVHLLLSHGSMYMVCNSNLLYHASIPLNEDGSLREVSVFGTKCSGIEMMKRTEHVIRAAFNTDTPKDKKKEAKDYFWYLWCGTDSPLFDKSRMTTFERYFTTDKDLWYEQKGAYYTLRNQAAICDSILDSFGVKGEHRHIINGHVPVHVIQGESPIKADGKMMVIDGGFAEAYHRTTGIAGYTLVYHSQGFELIQHEPFHSRRDAVLKGTDIKSSKQIVEMTGGRILVRDTDRGMQLERQIHELRELLYAYRHGFIKEKKH